MIENLQIFISNKILIQLSKMEVSGYRNSRFILVGEILGSVVVPCKFLTQFHIYMSFLSPPPTPKAPQACGAGHCKKNAIGSRGATFNLVPQRSLLCYLPFT